MSFKTKRPLIEVFTSLFPAVSKRDIIEALAMFSIRAGTVTAFDSESMAASAKVNVSFEALVPAHHIMDSLELSENPDFMFSNGVLTLLSNGDPLDHISCPLSIGKFPNINLWDSKIEFQECTDEIIEAICLVSREASTDMTNPDPIGVHVSGHYVGATN